MARRQLPSKGSGNNRRGDQSRGSGKWASGHNGENEDKRTGFKAGPHLKSKGNVNKKKKT